MRKKEKGLGFGNDEEATHSDAEDFFDGTFKNVEGKEERVLGAAEMKRDLALCLTSQSAKSGVLIIRRMVFNPMPRDS